MKVQIFMPERAKNKIDTDLVKLTELLIKKYFKNQINLSGLGGEHGYGQNYENDTFMMHSFCWCDEDTCKWCYSCSRDYDKEDCPKDAFCDDDCKFYIKPAPNFHHKKSGFKVWWYKWIGRSSEYNKKTTEKEWLDIINDCVKSIKEGK